MTKPLPPWWVAFSHSRLSPPVFGVRAGFEEDVFLALDALAVPYVTSSVMFGNLYRSWPLLDGVVLLIDWHGFPRGLPTGLRVIGFRPFRLLCDLVGVSPPRRRFRAEGRAPTLDELYAGLARFLARPRADLERQASAGLGVSTAEGLERAVRRLFGNRYLPAQFMHELGLRQPADGVWGDAGFSRRDRALLTEAGCDLDSAVAWRDLEVAPDDVLLALEHGHEAIAAWREAGFSTDQALHLLRANVVLTDVMAYLQAGCPRWLFLFKYLVGHRVPAEVCREYVAQNIRWERIPDYIGAGLSVDDARRGASPYLRR